MDAQIAHRALPHVALRAGVIVALSLIVLIITLRFLSRSVLFPGSTTPLDPGEVGYVCYSASDGLELHGIFLRASDPARPTVLYFHGNAESVADARDVAHDLAAMGFGVFLAEYRGYGATQGQASRAGLLRDGAGALTFLEASGVHPSSLVIVGRSVGSAVATEVASRTHPAQLILISPFTSVVDVARGVLGPIAPLVVRDPFDVLTLVRALPYPVTVIHGSADEVIPSSMGRAVADAAPNGRVVSVPGATHNAMPSVAQLVADAIIRPPG